MPKISSVKVDNENLDEENIEILDEVLPEVDKDDESVQKYPKLYLVLILTALFVILSNSMVTNIIVGLTPSFKERPYLATVVQAGIFAAVAFILFRSGRFE
jgi:hypothetical protein